MTKASTLFTNARVFDGHGADYVNGHVLVEGDRITQLVDAAAGAPKADTVIDVGGKVLMPGLIDAHVHVYASHVDLTKTVMKPATYLASFAGHTLRRSLDWGFTTVRDTGGADVGLADAIADSLLPAPRLIYGGKILSETGGHGDFRRRGEIDHHLCGCMPHGCGDTLFARIVDSPDAARHAVRDERRQGASHIKIMGSGGVASPSDPLEKDQFSDDEIRVIVEECERKGIYVTAHCHPKQAIRRCVELGVRCIEHGTLIDDETAEYVASMGAYVVPTLSVIFALKEEGRALGFPEVSMAKLEVAYAGAMDGVIAMHKAGVKMGFGTDLLGKQQIRQCGEFELRMRIQSSIDVLRSATSMNAEILMLENELGCIKPGAFADILVVDGDPIADARVLGHSGETLDVIMAAGRLHKNRLG
jgi:imidazolonepropionase-like amidohydrolase